MYYFLDTEILLNMQVPENIHTSPTEEIGIFGVGVSVRPKNLKIEMLKFSLNLPEEGDWGS